MKFFKAVDEKWAKRIDGREHREAKTAGIMRIFITVMVVVSVGVVWFMLKEVPWVILGFLGLIGFYWLWYQWLPRFERRWELEDEQRELCFARLLYKYVDAQGLENLLQQLEQRLGQLESGRENKSPSMQ